MVISVCGIIIQVKPIKVNACVSMSCLTINILYVLLYFYFEDINECESDPCQNGAECLDEWNRYTCICTPGFTGYNCERRKF